MRPTTLPESSARVRALRQALGMSQRLFAERGGITREHLSTIENGGNQATSALVRRAVARGASVPTDSLDAYLDGALKLDELLAARISAPTEGAA